MDIDEAFRTVGQYGRMQRQVFWSMAIPQAFVAWHHILNVFVGTEPNFHCITKNDVSLPDKQCAVSSDTPCLRYVFSDDEYTSIVSEVEIRNFV